MTGGPRPGAGRPRVYPEGYVSRTLSLDKRADDVLDAYCASKGVTRSQAASRLILIAHKARLLAFPEEADDA